MNSEQSSPSLKMPCPYPDCSGWVSAGQVMCTKCRRKLMTCPNCHRIMGKDIGLCGYCGYSPVTGDTTQKLLIEIEKEAGGKATLQSERRISFVSAESSRPFMTAEETTRLVAEAYYQAALTGANMHQAADALQAIRGALGESLDIFVCWDAIDHHVGQVEEPTLQQVLAGLRQKFIDLVKVKEITRLQAAFQRDGDSGWQELLSAYTTALSYWRLTLCEIYCQARLNFPKEQLKELQKIRQYNRLLVEDRLYEAYPFLIQRAEDDHLPAERRIQLFLSAMRIELNTLENPSKARELLERASQLNPNSHAISCGWAEYYLQQNDISKAREYAQEAIRSDPQESDGYALMGDTFDREKMVETAADWYRQAIQNDSGNEEGYLRLLRLYGQPGEFEAHEAQLGQLLDRAIAVEPPSEYFDYLSIGYVYEQNNRLETAHKWYDRAVKLQPEWIRAYTYKGYAYLTEEQFDQAEQAFQKVIALAPRCFDGYWGIAFVFELQGDWQPTLHWYRRCLKYRPEWEDRIRSKMGEMLYNLHRDRQAETELLRSLECNPDYQPTLNLLYDLANFYVTDGQLEAAQRVYDSILKIKGASFQADYHNFIGNMLFFYYDYQEAIKAYQKAIDISPEAVYYANLAGAWEGTSQVKNGPEELDHAIQALRKAVSLEPLNQDYASRLENLEINQRVSLTYGQKAFDLTPWVDTLGVELSTNLRRYYLKKTSSSMYLTEGFQQLVQAMQKRLRDEYGSPVPGIIVTEVTDRTRTKGTCNFHLRNIPLVGGTLPLNKRFFPGKKAALKKLNIPIEEVSEPPQGLRGYWVSRDAWDKVTEAGLPLWDVMEFPLRHLEENLVDYLDEFIILENLYDMLSEDDSETYENAKNDLELMAALCLTLRTLLKGKVPIRSFKPIVDRFLEVWKPKASLVEIIEQLRAIPQIKPKLPGNNKRYAFFQTDPNLEEEIIRMRKGECEHPELVYLAFILTIKEKGQDHPELAFLVNGPGLRPYVENLVRQLNPEIPVLARSEWQLSLITRLRGEISLPDADVLSALSTDSQSN